MENTMKKLNLKINPLKSIENTLRYEFIFGTVILLSIIAITQ